MSVDGSETSSHIRQFGLYRTIDAKTEEFLKLSKKRQIKQGCACAAISTVITVAIVISVIIIYEYSMIPSSKPKSNVRQNWLSFMNNSIETMPFELKFDKTKINPATVQILPLILKTIKKNVYFDKIIEDSINSSTSYDKKDSTEEPTSKDKVTNTKNWVRFPVSKLYTIEYKTSPILYFKNPTRGIDYFTKIRKIRDYQRVMNYVDKMINDKGALGTTVPMAKYIYNSYKIPNVENTTPMATVKKGNSKHKKMKKKQISASTQTKQPNCKCKEGIRDLLRKFITNLKELLPSTTDKTHIASMPCEMNKPMPKVKARDKGIQLNIKESLNNPSYSTSKVSEQNSYNMPEQYQSRNQMPSGVHKFIKPKAPTENFDYSYKTFRKPHITHPYMTLDYNEQLSTTIKKTEHENIFHKSQTSLPVSKTDYNNYNNTESNIIDYFKVLDAHSLELVKNIKIPGRRTTEFPNSKSNETILENVSSSSPTYNTSDSGREVVFDNSMTNTSEVNDTEYINIPTLDTTTHNDSNITTVQPLTTDTTTLRSTVTEYSYNSSTTNDTILGFEDVTVEEEIYKLSTDNPEMSIKNLENMIKKLNNSTEYSNTNKADVLYDWELVNVEEDKYSEDIASSMIPHSRSSYLEIQRNEWKNEEQPDYDNNFNNYLLE